MRGVPQGVGRPRGLAVPSEDSRARGTRIASRAPARQKSQHRCLHAVSAEAYRQQWMARKPVPPRLPSCCQQRFRSRLGRHRALEWPEPFRSRCAPPSSGTATGSPTLPLEHSPADAVELNVTQIVAPAIVDNHDCHLYLPNQLAYRISRIAIHATMSVTRSRVGRKGHVQQLLFNYGGKRKGAGRKPRHGRACESHHKRDEVGDGDVLHVVLRAVSRRREPARRGVIYKAVRAASVIAASSDARRGRFRINHLSIQRDHIHMLVEAENAEALAKGMQGFQISAARRINTALRVGGRRRRGSVFADRYHVVIVRCPKQARHVLAYVLGNWRKHGEDRKRLAEDLAGRSVLQRGVVRGMEGARGRASLAAAAQGTNR